MTPLSEVRRQRALDLVAPMVPRRPRVVAAEALGTEWAPVTRLHLDVPVGSAGTSVVVKTTRENAGDWGGIEHLRRERAALELLRGGGPAPTLLGSDEELELIVMSDVEGPALEEVLLGCDAVAATTAVVGLGDALGRLHVATLDREDEHLAALAAKGSLRPAADRYGAWAGVDAWDDIERAAEALGFPSARRAGDDVAFVRERLLAPGPFLALTHTDASPRNVIVASTGVALVDFEGSGFRHVGLDVAWLHFPFPNYSAHYAVLPHEVVHAADAAYRAQLGAAVPDARSDQRYGAMLAVGLAAALVVRTHRLARLASEGQPAYDSWRRRTQLVQHIGVFVERCRITGDLPELATWFEHLAGGHSPSMVRRGDARTPAVPGVLRRPRVTRRRGLAGKAAGPFFTRCRPAKRTTATGLLTSGRGTGEQAGTDTRSAGCSAPFGATRSQWHDARNLRSRASRWRLR